jgi:predicted nucleic acid-binding protein
MNGETPGKMDNPRFVLDSTVIIGRLNKQLDLDTFFGDMPNVERLTSIIGFIEALSKSEMLVDEDQNARSFLSTMTILDILPSIRDMTIEIRRVTKIKLPDAVIAATAIILDATLLSNDPHHLKLVWPGLKVQSVP